MAVDTLNLRRFLLSLPLALAALAVLVSRPLLAQVGVTTAKSIAPDPRAREEQRRLTLSHRRRLEETQENAQNNQILTASQDLPSAITTGRSRHRPLQMHRGTAAHVRRVARTAPSPGTGQ